MNLKDKKTSYLIEIRKQQFNDYFTSSRRKLDTVEDDVYDPVEFDKAIKMLHSSSLETQFFLYKLKEVRRMSCYKSFYIKNELLSDDFTFFIDEIVQKYQNEDEIIIELTHFLVNCFYEENFRVKFSQTLIETLNIIAENKNKEVIDNLFNILLNLSSDEAGAKVVANSFKFERVSGYLTGNLNNTGIEIELIPLVGLNILKKVKGLEFYKV